MFHLGGKVIKQEQKACHLGIWFETGCKFMWREQYKFKVKKASTVANVILGLNRFVGTLPAWDMRTPYMARVDPPMRSNEKYQSSYGNVLATLLLIVGRLVRSLVAPAELESFLLTHPNIADATVIGVFRQGRHRATPTARAHAVPKKRPSSISDERAFEQKIQTWTASLVAPYKYLRGVAIIHAVPKSVAGKILRKELRALKSAKL
ncbi:hypothetical protein C8R44DRAFT_751267 [Mycena epipterygia]|nr:hypothetical protein C8R44DRAFT_751267 [Mycena epipterygia]